MDDCLIKDAERVQDAIAHCIEVLGSRTKGKKCRWYTCAAVHERYRQQERSCYGSAGCQGRLAALLLISIPATGCTHWRM